MPVFTRFVGTLVLTLTFMLAVAQAGDAALIRIGTDPWIANYPANVAATKGFWKEQGLEVKIITYETDSERANATKSGKVHCGISMLGSALSWIQEGLPVTVLAETDWSHGGDKFIITKGIEAKALAGKRIGIYVDDTAVCYFLAQALAKHGLTLAQVELVEMEPDAMTKQFLAGKLPAIVNYDPAASNAVAGGGVQVASTADFPGVMPEGLVANRERWSELSQDQQTKLLRGWVKAVTWSKDPANWQELCTIIRTQTYAGAAEGPKDEAAVKELLAGVLVHDAKTMAKRNQDDLRNWLTEVKGFLKQNKRLKEDFDPAAIFDPAPIAAASR